MVSLWNQQNSECQGGAGNDPQTQASCAARDAYSAQLRAAGWCYGEPGDFGYQMAWHRCGSSDNSDNGSSETDPQQSLQQQTNSISIGLLPAQILDCLFSATTKWTTQGVSDANAIEDCKVPVNQFANAIARTLTVSRSRHGPTHIAIRWLTPTCVRIRASVLSLHPTEYRRIVRPSGKSWAAVCQARRLGIRT
jgi:hypothetical protein